MIVGHGAGDAGDSCSAQAAGATGSGSVTAVGSLPQQSSAATAAGSPMHAKLLVMRDAPDTAAVLQRLTHRPTTQTATVQDSEVSG